MASLNDKSLKSFLYYFHNIDSDSSELRSTGEGSNIPGNVIDKLLDIAGREALRERTPTLEELEQTLQQFKSQFDSEQEKNKQQESRTSISRGQLQQSKDDISKTRTRPATDNSLPIVTQLIQAGYLKDSKKWLSTKGFMSIGNKILADIMKALKSGDLGIHETTSLGSGSILIDSTKSYEPGDDVHLINVSRSLLNTVQRLAGEHKKKSYGSKERMTVDIPLSIKLEDFEEYETMEDVRVAVVYCIDLSSTMRYTSMFGEMSRIEAAKRALWSLYLMNKKFFPSDSIYIVGFGALASKVAPLDIPYLKTFEPGGDFLHYTNYQAAFRLASKILQKDGSENKRIVLVTDGHPSACFIDEKSEQEKILSQRPYSHFYTPDKDTIDNVKQNNDMVLDVNSGNLVYLCYRYRQVDQYIGERTIVEAKRCRRLGIEIDTVMISEEDSLLGYVNEMERYVRGKSYYINPSEIDKILLTDYLTKKKITLRG